MARQSKRRNTWIPPSKEMKRKMKDDDYDGIENFLVIIICLTVMGLIAILTI